MHLQNQCKFFITTGSDTSTGEVGGAWPLPKWEAETVRCVNSPVNVNFFYSVNSLITCLSLVIHYSLSRPLKCCQGCGECILVKPSGIFSCSLIPWVAPRSQVGVCLNSSCFLSIFMHYNSQCEHVLIDWDRHRQQHRQCGAALSVWCLSVLSTIQGELHQLSVPTRDEEDQSRWILRN